MTKSKIRRILAITTVMPCSRLRRSSVSNTSFFAPMSIPRVGSETNRNLGDMHNALATHTFCWLPPERVPAHWVGPKQRMSKSFIISFAVLRMAAVSFWVKGPSLCR